MSHVHGMDAARTAAAAIAAGSNRRMMAKNAAAAMANAQNGSQMVAQSVSNDPAAIACQRDSGEKSAPLLPAAPR